MSDMKDRFVACARCARDGIGGAALSHLGCIAVPLAAGAAGAGISGAFMMAAMFIASPLIAAGASYGLDRLRGAKPSAVKMAAAAGFALVVAFGIHAVFGHDHGGNSTHTHHGRVAAAQNARALGMTPSEYADTICTGGRNDLEIIP